MDSTYGRSAILSGMSWTNSSKKSRARCGNLPTPPDWPHCPFPAKHCRPEAASRRLPDDIRPVKRLASIMDQRVDNERRPDSERRGSPARRAPPSFDEADDRASWRQRLRRRGGFVLLLVVGGVIVAALLVGWWLHARNYESTDDAFIDSRTVQISAQVAAAIVDVPVTDNQLVDAGAELVRLDDRDYVAQRDQAQAQVKQAQASVDNLTAQIEAQQAKVDQAHKQVAQAHATLEQAQVNLVRTIVTAPVGGRVTKLTAAKGGYAAVGQALMMFVPREVWVTANFKETQLDFMRPGQPVDIAIDAYPGRRFAGHVDSVQSGSGTAFSLLPAENATGNYVKIVQRVPVKITFDKIPDVLLGPGMSVVPTVKVR